MEQDDDALSHDGGGQGNRYSADSDLEPDHDVSPHDGGGQDNRYSADSDLDMEPEVDMEINFDLPTDVEPQYYLPQSFLPTGGGSANPAWALGTVLVSDMDSANTMRCFNPISDCHDGVRSSSYVFSNLQNSSGSGFNGNTSEILPEAGANRTENYSYPFVTDLGQNQFLDDQYVPFEEALDGPIATSDSSFPLILPPYSSENVVSTTSSSQERTKPKSKASSSDKYKLNAMVTCFPTNQPQAKTSRTKKPIPPGQREKYKLARDVKSCSRCKARKIKFTWPRPCEACIKAAGSSDLASWICIQNSFVELRFGSFDLLLVSFTRDFLSSEIESRHGPRRSIRLGMVFHEGQQVPTELAVPITVRDYSTPDSEDSVLYHRVALDRNNFDIVLSERYAIVPESVPKLHHLLSWADANMTDARGQSVQQLLITNLKEFMDQYCGHLPRLPLHDLLRSSSRILKLVRCWRCTHYDLSNCDNNNPLLVSKKAKNQIVLVLKKGIESEERLILTALQKVLYGAKGPGRDNMIPLWASMWSLILTYRDCMAVYKQYAVAPRPNKFQPGCSNHEMVVGASKHMYNILTTNYAALFRQSSPLYIDWRKQKNFDLIGRNEVLRRAFDDLRTQIIKFYQSSGELSDDDALLREWIVDQESKLRPHDPHKL